jgi:hypothetical protein
LEYNFVTKIFNYITLHAEAAATVHTILGMSFKGGIVVDYSWGLNDQANPVPGPKLMGAYTVNTTDYNAHYPQGYVPNKDPVYNPYAQDFLALVPQNPDSYQTYNIVINSPVYNFTTGQHMYFLSQPRFFGLEYTSGLKHIVIRSAKSPAPSEDSFRN